jgi:hypothetical protein
VRPGELVCALVARGRLPGAFANRIDLLVKPEARGAKWIAPGDKGIIASTKQPARS